jgi:hypothetical protein
MSRQNNEVSISRESKGIWRHDAEMPSQRSTERKPLPLPRRHELHKPAICTRPEPEEVGTFVIDRVLVSRACHWRSTVIIESHLSLKLSVITVNLQQDSDTIPSRDPFDFAQGLRPMHFYSNR